MDPERCAQGTQDDPGARFTARVAQASAALPGVPRAGGDVIPISEPDDDEGYGDDDDEDEEDEEDDEEPWQVAPASRANGRAASALTHSGERFG